MKRNAFGAIDLLLGLLILGVVAVLSMRWSLIFSVKITLFGTRISAEYDIFSYDNCA